MSHSSGSQQHPSTPSVGPTVQPQWGQPGYQAPLGAPRPTRKVVILVVIVSVIMLTIYAYYSLVVGPKLSVYEYGQIAGEVTIDHGQQNDPQQCQEAYDQVLARGDPPFKNTFRNNSEYVQGCLSAS